MLHWVPEIIFTSSSSQPKDNRAEALDGSVETFKDVKEPRMRRKRIRRSVAMPVQRMGPLVP